MKNYLLAALCLAAMGTYSCKKDSNNTDTSGEFKITSAAVVDGELLDEYKCETKVNDIEPSIPLAWSNVPDGTGSLAICMIHYPNESDTTSANHYLLLWDIDPSVTEMPYGTADDGPWYMGSDKDSTAISYTSPCSQGSGTHEYIIRIFALSETPSSLPDSSSITVNYDMFKAAIESVNIIQSNSLVFDVVTP